MIIFRLVAIVGAIALASVTFNPVHAQQIEKRIALVVGESAYSSSALATAANDAGLVSETLQAAGFDVTGARDLNTQQLRDALHEFIEKARASGPDTVAMVYFAGYGLQSEGENFLTGVDARIDSAADIAMNAIRASDFVKPLAALPLKARIVVLDAARNNPFVKSGQALAGGLALAEPDDGSLIAFNAAPGTVGPDESGPYGVYAKALVEMVKAGGAPVNEMFERVRARVAEATKGGQIPWSASRIASPIVLFAHTAEAPKDQSDQFAALASKPITNFNARDAYQAAVARDTLEGYEEFLAAFPNDPMAPRVRAIVAARREATIWRSSCSDGKPRAYWSYLKRYPRGPHVYEARQRLTHLNVAVEPPPSFDELAYDVPPPPPDEIVYVEHPVVYLDDPDWGFAPPPPVPVVYLVAEPAYFVDLPPPPPPIVAFVLPIPVFYPVAAWVAPPVYVAPAPINVFAVNIHNTVVVNQVTNSVMVTNAAGQHLPPLPANAPAPAANIPAPAAGALHPAVAGAAAALPIAAAAALHRSQQTAPGPSHALPAPNALPPGGKAPPGAAPNFAAPKPGPSLGTRPVPSITARPTPAPGAGAAPSVRNQHFDRHAPANAQAPLTHRPPPSVAAPRPTAPRFAAPHPAAPQRFEPRRAPPHFAAPGPAAPQHFAPRPQQPHFAAPPPAAPHFAAPPAPRPTPQFRAQQPAPHFAPAAPHFAPAPGPRGPAPGKPTHWPPQH